MPEAGVLMSRQWMLPNGVMIDETGTRDWNALGVSVSEMITDEQAAELVGALLSMSVRFTFGL